MTRTRRKTNSICVGQFIQFSIQFDESVLLLVNLQFSFEIVKENFSVKHTFEEIESGKGNRLSVVVVVVVVLAKVYLSDCNAMQCNAMK